MTAVRVELRKLLTTRLWWILLLGLAGYMAFLAALLAVAFTRPEVLGGTGGDAGLGIDASAVATSIYTLPASTGYVFPLVIGALAVTTEYRYQTITPTFLAQPHRGVVLAAKMASSLAVGLVLGVVATVVTVAAGAGVLAAMGEATRLDDPEVRRSLLLTCLALGIWAMVGTGFGAVLTNQVASIIVVLAFTQFVEPILRLFLGTNEVTAGVSRFLPSAAGEALAGGGLFGGITLADPLTWWQGGAVLLAYALVFAAIGSATTLRKDVG
jgi:ABC-type transport system involved in multi-copper enzyme maturation permease subunit